MSQSVVHFTVVVLLSRVAETPVSSTELEDFEQEEARERAEATLQQEAVAQQEEELIHALCVHLLQLITDTMQLQHQAVHLINNCRFLNRGISSHTKFEQEVLKCC